MNFLFIIAKLSYYPRIIFEFILSKFIKNDWSQLEKFKNQEVLIVGNGPSLNLCELNKIGGVHIGMNKINLIFERKNWKPDIIVCVNGLVIKQNLSFFNSTDIVLVLPIKSIFLGIKKRNNVLLVRSRSSKEFIPNLKEGLTPGSTVTTNAMQIAALLKPSKINIVGVDHNFTFKGDSHEIKKMEGEDVNHFDKNYFKGQLWGLPDLLGSEKNYKMAKDYFDKNNVEVVDYTINGKLTIFPKGDINNLYKEEV